MGSYHRLKRLGTEIKLTFEKRRAEGLCHSLPFIRNIRLQWLVIFLVLYQRFLLGEKQHKMKWTMWEWKLRFRLCQPNTSRSSQSAFNCLGEHSFVPTTYSILHSHVITPHKITDNLACLPRAFNWSTSSKLDWAIPVRKNASNQDMNILTENLYNDQRIWQITRFNLIYMTVWYYTLCGFELHNI